MSDDVEADFARLHGTSQMGLASFNAAGSHPLFSAIHSFALAHRYGREDVSTYMRNPGLRSMDTRQAAMEGLQKAGEGVRRYADMYRPSIPGPIPPMPGPAPTVPGGYKFSGQRPTAPAPPAQSPVTPPGHYLP